jgi:signal transduction histidine kinase
LVGEVRRELEPEAGVRRVEWRVGELPAVNGDAVLLRQVLVNLLSNALKFTRQRDPAVIEISGHRRTSAVPPEVILEVRDNGAGFNPEHAAKLFQTFQRLHNPREFEGNGIGLATVKRIVERHGGRIWAEGKIDQGAMFSIALPDP